MSAAQTTLAFDPPRDAIAEQRKRWRLCWDWAGPEPGGLISFHCTFADDTTGKVCYVYMANARVVSVAGTSCLVEYVGTTWTNYENGKEMQRIAHDLCGRQFNLPFNEVWPCCPLLQGHAVIIFERGQFVEVKP